MQKKNSRRKPPALIKNPNELGSRAITVLVDMMIRDGVTLDRKTPERIARLAKRLNWSYGETAAFARSMLAFASTKVFTADEPLPPEPEKKPDMGRILDTIFQVGQTIFQLIPDTNPNGKSGGLTNLLGLVSTFFSQPPANTNSRPAALRTKAPRCRKKTKRKSPPVGTKTK